MSLGLFVYGTLLRGGGRHGLVGPARRLPARTGGALWAMPEGWPALSAGDGVVHGEWVAPVDDATLARLDAYEGVDEGLYVRRAIRVDTPEGPVEAWAWVMDDPASRGGRRIASGRWRAGTLES